MTVIASSLLLQQDKKPPSGQSQMEDMYDHLLLRQAHHQRVMTLQRHASAQFRIAAWPAAASDSEPVEAL